MVTGFRREDLRRFRTYIKDRWGISIAEGRDYLVEAKLRKALDATGLEHPEALFDLTEDDQIQRVAQAVTTNHTFFFRESDHFDILLQDARAKRLSRPLIWSAAASSGEECYSLVIRLLEAGWEDFLVLASDIDHRMLENVHQGLYPEFRLQNVPPGLRDRYFEERGLRRGTVYYQVRPELRRRVVVKTLNLLEPHRFPEAFDYVLCRNVLIYFDHPTQGGVIDDLSRTLKPGGLLFLGHSESLMAIPHHFRFEQVAASVYRMASSAGGSDAEF